MGGVVTEAEREQLFASLWRFLQLSLHDYGASSTGEMLVVMTIIILDRSDRHPTVMDLAELTGVAKSNVSRYVARQIRRGHLSEKIDPHDRRRRIFAPTAAGRKELKRLDKQIEQVAGSVGAKHDDLYAALIRFASARSG